MRNDVRNLLSKLGRPEYRYHEFADQFGDMDLWPIFEVLLRDERIYGRPMSRLEARRMEPSASQASDHVDLEVEGGDEGSGSAIRSFFRRLEN